MQRAVIYCRVSTDDQENNTSLEQQEIDCREYALQNGLDVVKVFRETFTGALYRERKLLTSMREMYPSIDAVIFRTFDRLSREVSHYYILTEEMRVQSVELHCAKENVDNSTYGQLIRLIVVSFAKIEREKILDRTTTGMKARVTQKGWYMPGGKAPYGYRFNDVATRAKLLIDEEEAKIVREIYTRFAAGESINNIAVDLTNRGVPLPSDKTKSSTWSRFTIRYLLKRGEDLYGGTAYAYKHEWTKVYKDGEMKTNVRLRPVEERLKLPDGTVPMIVEAELIERCMQRLQTNKQDSARRSSDPQATLLRGGFAKCGECGYNMAVNRHKSPKSIGGYNMIYRCGGAAARLCKGTFITTMKLDRVVWDYVCGLMADLRVIEGAIEKVLETKTFVIEEQAAKSSLDAARAMLEQYREDLRSTTLGQYTRNIILQDMEKQAQLVQELEHDISLIQLGRVSHDKVIDQYRKFVGWINQIDKVKTEMTWDEKRQILRFFGICVRVFREGGERRWEIDTAPPTIMKSLFGSSVIGSTLGRVSTHNEYYLLRYSLPYGTQHYQHT